MILTFNTESIYGHETYRDAVTSAALVPVGASGAGVRPMGVSEGREGTDWMDRVLDELRFISAL